MKHRRILSFVAAAAVFGTVAFGEKLVPIAAAEQIQLPYQVSDNDDNTWMVHYQGQIHQQGNQPIFSQAGMITINGRHPQQQNNQQAKLDEKTRELILNFNVQNNVKHTRRVKFDEQTGIARVIDLFENNADRDASLNLQLMTNINYGVNAVEIIEDPRKKGQLAWAADTGAGRAALSVWGGKGAKTLPAIRYNQGNNAVQASFNLKVPAKSEAAIVHWHGTFDSLEEAQAHVIQSREIKLLSDLPLELRKAIVNIGSGGSSSIGDRELLRGDQTDVVELRGGDQMRGDLELDTYKLNTAYGPVELPASKIVSLLNVGDFRARQLLVTQDGEIFGGELAEPVIPLQLASGQVRHIPLSHISRLGYRTGGAEPPEWKFEKSMVFLRSGERCAIAPLTKPIEFVTRYGSLTIKPEQVAAVNLKSGSGMHEVYLSDGSKLSGILSTPQWALRLTTASGEEPIDFPLAAIARVQVVALPEDVGAGKATLSLQGGDIVATRLEGQLKLVTTFDTIDVNAGEIRAIARPDEGLPDVQVTMFDQSTFRGTLQTASLKARLVGDLSIDVPVAAIQDYENPQPFPAGGTVERANAAIARLSAEDWKDRETAESQLINMGPSVISVLEAARDTASPEVQQRLNGLVTRLRKDVTLAPTRLAPPPSLE